MKFTLSWLKDHLDTDASATEIAEKLTAIGLELEGYDDPAERLSAFRIARITECAPHPNADKLRLCRVDDGSAEMRQVVCGAPNAHAGLIGVLAPVGAHVPGPGFTVEAAKIRGERSEGMLCSERELGLGDDHEGIIALPDDAPVGEVYARWAGHDDPLFDISVTPNRQDCMGVRGIARDLAAAGLGELKTLSLPAIERRLPAPDIATEDKEGCPAFYATRVKGVTNGPAPDWMRKRLRAIGQKPISALVDITNYVMIDLGRPLHVYDMARLEGPLVARKAKAGESVRALNGKDYRLETTMTVLADQRGAHDIGGVMGGERTGAEEQTTDILIECAYFTPETIALTGQKLGLTSDARQRFERGVDPAFLETGLDIATGYVLRLCGGEASEMAKAGEPPIIERSMRYDPALSERLAGLAVDADEQRAILGRLGFAVGDDWTVTAPSWRRDIDGPADLVEEVVRIIGLDKLPSTPLPRPPGVARTTLTPAQIVERRVRRAAANMGLSEAVNWSFISEAEPAGFGGGDWTLANPISEELKVMRPSLLPGLLSAAKRNLDRGAPSVRLFEIGRRYFRDEDGASDERPTLGFVLAGDRKPRDWRAGRAEEHDAFDAKHVVERALEAAGLDPARLLVSGEAGAHFHPGQGATFGFGPTATVAAFGAFHPSLLKAFGLKGAIVGGEVFVDALPPRKAKRGARAPYAPPPLQAVRRDFAFLAPAALSAGDLVRAILAADKTNIVAARIFDRFAGEGVPEGHVSLAVEVVLQPGDKSYEDADLAAISKRVVKAAAKLGAELRS